MPSSLSPELLAWREAQIRSLALQLKYRRLCRNPTTPAVAIATCIKDREAAQAACRCLRKPRRKGTPS